MMASVVMFLQMRHNNSSRTGLWFEEEEGGSSDKNGGFFLLPSPWSGRWKIKKLKMGKGKLLQALGFIKGR